MIVPEMVAIGAGEYWMGADDEEDKFASVLEKPRHRVRIARPFLMGRTPVTFEEWDVYAEAVAGAHRPDDAGWGRGRLPVFNVSFDDASAYVQWLAAESGLPYQLPTEEQWEYCCRAGSESVFSTGGKIELSQANFLYMDFGGKLGVGRPVPVGSYPPNAFGLYDMHGNVCELVADPWRDGYAAAAESEYWRVVRGGGWDALPRILRCAFRDWVGRDQRLDNMGFRLVCED
jgi:formylglycine-generating enzyme required for sulfatase activity